MLDFKEITIKDKALFNDYFKLFSPQESEMNFTNLFMWRNFYRYRYIEINGMLCGIADPQTIPPFAFMPVGVITKELFADTIYKLKEYFTNNGWELVFRSITENELLYFKRFIGIKDDNIVFDRDDSDYIYLLEDLAELKGKKYDGKRNHINKLKKNHRFEYVSMTKEHIGECYRIMELWCSKRNCKEHMNLYCEKLANVELLNHFDELGCKGALIKVDDKYEAFTVGEMLNSNTAVIHLEKADSSIDGLYPLINQMFCRMEWANAKYINREQDIGIEGIRKAKLSYHPVKLLKKHVVTVE